MKQVPDSLHPRDCSGSFSRAISHVGESRPSMSAIGAPSAARRAFFVLAAAACVQGPQLVVATPREKMTVWKSPTCGCCTDWINHVTAAGFDVETRDEGNNAARKRLGMPQAMGSCHTATVGDYVIEGHVPANDIRRLLTERPKALGLAVPGMPIGSPGMDGLAYGGRKDAYDVLLVQRDGSTSSFARYAGN